MSWFDAWQHLNDAILLEACTLWGIDDLQHISSSANAVYRARRGRELVYLRLCHQTQRDEAFLATGVDWARQLAVHEAQVCVPLESEKGNYVERVGNEWLSVLWRGIDGVPLGDNNSPKQLEAWGQALGRLHVASTHYTPRAVATSSGFVTPEGFSLVQFWQNISPILEPDAALSQAHQELGIWLKSLPTTGMRLCHNDFRPANTIWDGKKAWVIDFDEPTLAYPEYDLARACLRDDCKPFSAPHLEYILRGYEQILPCERERISTFVRIRALLMLAWDLEDPSWGTEFIELGRNLALSTTLESFSL